MLLSTIFQLYRGGQFYRLIMTWEVDDRHSQIHLTAPPITQEYTNDKLT